MDLVIIVDSKGGILTLGTLLVSIGIYLLVASILSLFFIVFAAIAEGEFSQDCIKIGITCGFLTPVIFLPSMISVY